MDHDAKDMDTPAAQSRWCSLPADLVLQIEAYVALQGNPGCTASMRATCQAWRAALTLAPVELQPLGKPAQLAAFPQAVSLDYAARGAGQSLCDGELEDACSQLGAKLEALSICGAFQLTTAGVQHALRCCTALRHMAADGSTLQDAAFSALLTSAGGSKAGPGRGSSSSSRGSRSALSGLLLAQHSPRPVGPPLQQLETLSLRGCLFLRGTLLADLAVACPVLSSLDLADCALALNLNPDVAALIQRLTCLRRLALDNDGVDDAAMRHIAALPHLRELSLRGSVELTDAGLHHLAGRRGNSTPVPRTSSSSTSSGLSVRSGSGGDTGGSCGAGMDVGLVSLYISGCSGFTDGCWLAITEMQGLTALCLEHMGHLLQFPAMPEALPAALWRLPRLRRLSLAGSCCHPSKLKLLGATCGSSVTHLDIGTGGSGGSCSVGEGCVSCSLCCCRTDEEGGDGWWASNRRRQAAGPAYRRLTALHERDLCEAASSFRQLRSFSAAGSALPLRVVVAFVEAAPAGRLTELDLSGCCLDAEPATAATAHSQQQQLFFSSGARRTLTFDSYPAVTGTSATRLQQLHAEVDSWQRPATAARFATSLRRQAGSLRRLRLGGTCGVTDRHLCSLRSLSALECLCLAGCRAALSPTLLAEVAAGCPRLQRLDISNTTADDACLAAAAAVPNLQELAASGCSYIGSAGVRMLAAGNAAATLRWLDLSMTGFDDLAAAQLASRCQNLRILLLTGCQQLMAAGAAHLGHLPRLTSLSLCRCPQAVTDGSLEVLARQLPLLTRLGLSEAHQLTAEGLAAALPLLPCLAELDLTCCWQLQDEQVLQLLRSVSNVNDGSGSSNANSSSSSKAGCSTAGTGFITPANVQLPKGGSSPSGSPFKRAAHVPA